MGKSLKIGAVVALVAAVVIGATVVSLFKASQQVPQFYRAAVKRDASDQHIARDEFVAETTALASDMHRSGRWRHVFTSEQINAWLTLELAVNYPGLLSGEWHDPRIEIDERKATIACRYENGSISTVMSLTVDVYLHAPNVIALRIRRARAGSLPVPLAQVLDAISQVARDLKLRLEWRKAQGDPVALVTFTPPRDSQSQVVRLSAIELRKGELIVAGEMLHGSHDRLAQADDTVEETSQGSSEPSEDQPLVGAAVKETRQE
jgi:hypothetical protein